jgi:hypothetical protein
MIGNVGVGKKSCSMSFHSNATRRASICCARSTGLSISPGCGETWRRFTPRWTPIPYGQQKPMPIEQRCGHFRLGDFASFAQYEIATFGERQLVPRNRVRLREAVCAARPNSAAVLPQCPTSRDLSLRGPAVSKPTTSQQRLCETKRSIPQPLPGIGQGTADECKLFRSDPRRDMRVERRAQLRRRHRQISQA